VYSSSARRGPEPPVSFSAKQQSPDELRFGVLFVSRQLSVWEDVPMYMPLSGRVCRAFLPQPFGITFIT